MLLGASFTDTIERQIRGFYIKIKLGLSVKSKLVLWDYSETTRSTGKDNSVVGS